MATAITTDTISKFSVITPTTEESGSITFGGGEITTASTNILHQTKFSAAEKLLRMGFYVFPVWGVTIGKCDCGRVCSSPGKHPHGMLGPKGGHHHASRKIDDIDNWWDQDPNANSGIRTGGGLLVIDVDGPTGEESLKRLERLLGPLPPTLQARSGKGRHLYLHDDSEIASCNGKWPGIDIKAEGGYVIGPGSTHQNGAIYQFVDDSVPMAQLPAAWLRALQEPNKKERTTTTTNSQGTYTVGERNDFLSDKAFHYKKTGLDGEVLFQAVNYLNHKHCSPPLHDSEVRVTCNGKRNIEPDPLPTCPVIQSRPQIQTLTEILSTEFPTQEWIVPGLLPSGLVILGGKSKAGKSWFVMNMCLAIAGGKLFIGDTLGEPKKILYLALEDPFQRIQNRAKHLLTPNGNTDNFLCTTQWDMFLDPDAKTKVINGEETLRKTLEEYGDIRLVVVDTWQRVRPRKKAFRDDYEADYAHLARLQTMAHQHDCAILLVHHARKDNEGAEKQDSLLGSTAIAGAADLIWILERKHGSSEGLITPSGRDIDDETPLAFKCENGMWEYLGRKTEVEMNDSQKKVMEFFKDKDPQKFSEIKKALDIAPATLTRALQALVRQGEIEYLEISKKYKTLRTTGLTENEVVFNQ